MKLSVALCTYNGEKYLHKQLCSILNQSLNVHEIIICDDNSTDNTKTILTQFYLNNVEIVDLTFNEINIGVIKNFENAISKCSGDIIFLSDQDDIWHYDKVKIIVDLFSRNQDALAVFTDADLINSDNEPISGSLWEKWGFDPFIQDLWLNNSNACISLMQYDNKATGATMALRNELRKSILPFENMGNYWHDAWICLWAAKKNGLFFIDNKTISYRIHPEQLIGIKNGILFNKVKVHNNSIKLSSVKKKLKLIIRRLLTVFTNYNN